MNGINLNPNWISVIIATVSFIVSCLALFLTRAKIKIHVSKDVSIFPDGAVFCYIDKKTNFKLESGIHTTIEFINYGDKDISYFNLFSLGRDGSELILQSSIIPLKHNQVDNLRLITETKVSSLNIPPDHSGIIPAHTYKKFDILITNIPADATKKYLMFQLSKSPSIRHFLGGFWKSHTGDKLKVYGYDNFETHAICLKFPKFGDESNSSYKKLHPRLEKIKENMADHETPFDRH